MMKQLLLYFSIMFSVSALAQQDTTTVYSRPGYLKDPMRSKWHTKVTSKNGLYLVSFYDDQDVLKEQIHFEDKSLSVRQGPYAFYTDGTISTEGQYDKGHKNGEWKHFEKQKLILLEHYTYGVLSGKYVSYWSNGNVKKEGSYLNGKKHGQWIMLYPNGKTAAQETYIENGVLNNGQYFHTDGSVAEKNTLFRDAYYKDGEEAYLSKINELIKYPSFAAKQKMSGTVKVSFMVMSNGELKDFRIAESDNGMFNREALRVVKMLKNWAPALEFGEKTESTVIVPVVFKLP
ncbi:energy transducer TonB [Pedobacter montanisoli]|uniref:TonB family protein n=1 Tax=Pedobacter montanisoli TaxID=2923277 RepID=A0ABS9ZSV0_9SPHI|nr:energy transducer TonB [Pedobacter montanisoli]MCJ0741681.1 TonB family protein [Pedobacter montanisoli]